MILKLVSSNDNRELAIRDHSLPLLRAYGTLEVQRDTVRVAGLQLGLFGQAYDVVEWEDRKGRTR